MGDKPSAWILGLALAAGCSDDARPAAPACDQVCVDFNTGRAIALLVDGLYNQNVAGKPGGTQRATGRCPVAGAAEISGSTGGEGTSAITTVDLRFSLTDCRVSTSGAELVFNGTIAYVGSFDSEAFASTRYLSESLDVDGTVDARPLRAEHCAVRVDRASATAPLTGEMCGRPF